jgi:hypothetical protein
MSALSADHTGTARHRMSAKTGAQRALVLDISVLLCILIG